MVVDELLKLTPSVGASTDESPVAAALASLGDDEPLSRALAAYLASRPDLLSIEECLALGGTGAGDATPLSGSALRGLFMAELGEVPEVLFDSFESEPDRIDYWYQWHSARLPDGTPAAVKIRVAPEPPAGAAAALVESALSGVAALAPHLEELADGFERRVRRAVDLEAEGRALAELREDSDRPASLAAAEPVAGLSRGRILTRERLGGDISAAAPGGSWSGEKRARRLSKVWLGQALSGSPFPLEPAAGGADLLSSGKVAFVDGPFGCTSESVRENLLGYLTAVASEEHERAADLLLAASGGASRDLESGLRHRFRHVAPFRDGGWLEDGDRLARLVVAQWRLATEMGLTLEPGVVDFMTGFFRLTERVRQLAPGSNAVSTGFQELRLHRIVSRVRHLLGDDEGLKLMERQIETIIELPSKLDRLLDLAAREVELRRRPVVRKNRKTRRRPAVLASLLVVLATTALLVGRFGDAPWVQGVGALAVLLIGTLFLLVARRPSR